MDPLILEIDKKKAYVIYGNLLLLDMPLKKLDDYLQKISSGNKCKGVTVLTMDSRFVMTYGENDGKIKFSDADTNKSVVFENVNVKQAIVEWLGEYLAFNKYNLEANAVSKSKLLARGAGVLVFIIFIFGMLYVAEGNSSSSNRGKARLFVAIANALGEKGILIGGAVCIIIAVIWTMRLVKKGEQQFTYSKNMSEMA